MDEKELGSIKGWFAGRLPDGWFAGVEVAVEDDQIVVVGTLPETNLGSTPEEKEGAAAGRIARFREETRGQRIGIAQEAEERFKKYVTWGARLDGVTQRFPRSVPYSTTISRPCGRSIRCTASRTGCLSRRKCSEFAITTPSRS